jgi:glycosyltransferase involved in cell wall biosynthesis
MTKELKQMCEHASAVHYVTQRELQRRFPPGLHTHVASYSDVMVEGAFPGANVFAQRYRRIAAMAHDPASTGPFRIGFVGSLSRLYKGLDILLQAISAIIKSRDTELQLVIVGGGLYLDRMKALASTLNLESRTLFLGQLPFGEPVFSLLDSIDLLVLPSRAEGLPRIIIEAIVRGCPCIGTNIGGMSELLSQEDLVPCNCPEALKSRIVELIRQPERLRRMIERNLETSRRFTPDVLVSAQRAFLQQIKQNCYT